MAYTFTCPVSAYGLDRTQQMVNWLMWLASYAMHPSKLIKSDALSTHFRANSSIMKCCLILGWVKYDGIGLPKTCQSICILRLTCLYLIACYRCHIHRFKLYSMFYKLMSHFMLCFMLYILMQVSCSECMAIMYMTPLKKGKWV